MKRVVILLANWALCIMSYSQSVQYFPLNMVPVPPCDFGISLPDEVESPKRTPERNTVLPTFFYEYDKIVISADSDWGEFTYYVINEENEIVLSDNGNIIASTPYIIDISMLEAGSYTFVVFHGKYYATSFAKD